MANRKLLTAVRSHFSLLVKLFWILKLSLPQDFCGKTMETITEQPIKKIEFFRCPQSLPGVAPLTKKPEDSGYEIGTSTISYPESSGFLVSGATPGRLWGHRRNSIFLIGCSETVSIVLPQKSCGNKIRCPQSLPGVAPLTKKPEDSGYEIVEVPAIGLISSRCSGNEPALLPRKVSSRGGTKTGLERAAEIEPIPAPHW